MFFEPQKPLNHDAGSGKNLELPSDLSLASLKHQQLQFFAQHVESNPDLPASVKFIIWRGLNPQNDDDCLVREDQKELWQSIDSIESLAWDPSTSRLIVCHQNKDTDRLELSQLSSHFLEFFSEQIDACDDAGKERLLQMVNKVPQAAIAGSVVDIQQQGRKLILRLADGRSFLSDDPITVAEFFDTFSDEIRLLNRSNQKLFMQMLSDSEWELLDRLDDIQAIAADPICDAVIIELKNNDKLYYFHGQTAQEFLDLPIGQQIKSLPEEFQSSVRRLIRENEGPWLYRGCVLDININDMGRVVFTLLNGQEPEYPIAATPHAFFAIYVRDSANLSDESIKIIKGLLFDGAVPDWCQFGLIERFSDDSTGAIRMDFFNGGHRFITAIQAPSDFFEFSISNNPLLSNRAKGYLKELFLKSPPDFSRMKGFITYICEDKAAGIVEFYTIDPNHPKIEIALPAQ